MGCNEVSTDLVWEGNSCQQGNVKVLKMFCYETGTFVCCRKCRCKGSESIYLCVPVRRGRRGDAESVFASVQLCLSVVPGATGAGCCVFWCGSKDQDALTPVI